MITRRSMLELASLSAVAAPCCRSQSVAIHDSPVAREMRNEIVMLASEGKTEEQIVDYYVARYGERILRQPPRTGMDLVECRSDRSDRRGFRRCARVFGPCAKPKGRRFSGRTDTMTKTIVLPGLLALGFALCLLAQNDADYPGWMKQIGATKSKVTKGIAAKQNADVATDAAHLADLFKQVGSFWAGKKVSDAETIAKNAETAANDLAAAAKAGDEAKMQSSLQAVNGSCGACHGAHREGSPGNYQIK